MVVEYVCSISLLNAKLKKHCEISLWEIDFTIKIEKKRDEKSIWENQFVT